MNNDIKFLNIEWKTQHSLTNFKDNFGLHTSVIFLDPNAGWETKSFWRSPEMGSLLYSLYKIPLTQSCFPLTRPNFHSHWRAGER